MNKLFKNLTLVLIAALFPIIAFTNCGSDDNNDDPLLVQEEKDRYEEFVTAQMQEAIDELGMTIHRGIYPPSIEGYFRTENNCISSTIYGDPFVGNLINNMKMHYFDQKGLNISMDAVEVQTDTDNFRASHEALGTFISGNGNKFSIFFEEKVTKDYWGSKYVYTVLTVMTGEVVKSNNKITGIKDFEYVFIMKDRNGAPETIDNGEGRLFTDDFVDAITASEYELIVKSLPNTTKGQIVLETLTSIED